MEEAKKDQLIRKSQERRRVVGAAIGIEIGFTPAGLLYNRPSGTILVSAERLTVDTFERCLFIRRTSESKYARVAPSSSGMQCWDAVTSSVLPMAYYRVVRVTKSDLRDEYAGEWISIAALDLEHRTTKYVITKPGLDFGKPQAGGWISGLHGVSRDDGALYCTCAFQAHGQPHIEHWLCTIGIATQRVEPISKLEGIWF